MAQELTKMGVKIIEEDDKLTIFHCDNLKGIKINHHNDHRIAMSFAVAGLVTGDQIIENEMCVAKSFPDFWERFNVFYQ